MTDRPEHDPSKRLLKKPLKPVNTLNARKHAERKKEIYRRNKGKEKVRR
jgi:hypothetical protein